MHQSKSSQAMSALDEAIALANKTGNDRLGREASMAMAAAYDMSGDTAMGDTWRAHADEYRERMASRVAPPPIQTASSETPSAAPMPSQAPVPSAMATGTKSVSQHWPWWLAALCLILFGAWWQSSRRAAHLHGQTEALARQQRHLKTAHQSLKSQTEEFRKMAVQDALTGTMNRQAFAGGLESLLKHAVPFGKPVALFVFDLDHFKTINDRHGHLAGDAALKLVVGVVQEKLQSEDLFGRFGGDEFLIGCFGLDRERAQALGERIRAAVVERAQAQVATPMPELSISMGIAHATPASGYDMEGLFARADTALYAAKRAGRNKVILEDESLPPPPQDQPALRSLAPTPHEA
jgi:diguanylate cyclase (GGDEF)-like protein